MHWVGSDIQAAREDPRIIAQLKTRRVLHLTEVEWTAQELQRLGFRARIAPLPPRLKRSAIPALPDDFTLLLYLPQTRADFYGRSNYEKLIHNLRHEKVRFLIVGGGALRTAFSAQVENLGYQHSMHKIYAASSALLRIPEHDGLSLMVLEALSLGRYVVWSHRFPFVTAVSEYEGIEAAVRALLERHLAGALPLKLDAAEFIAERYDYQRCLKDIARAWSDSRNRNHSAGSTSAR